MTIETLESLAVGSKVVSNKGVTLTVTHNSRHEHCDEFGRDIHTGRYYHSIALTADNGKVVTLRTTDKLAAGIVPQMEVA